MNSNKRTNEEWREKIEFKHARYIIQFDDGTLMATHSLEDKWVQSRMSANSHTIIDEDSPKWDEFKYLWTKDINKQGTLEAFMEAEDIEDRAVDKLLDMKRCK